MNPFKVDDRIELIAPPTISQHDLTFHKIYRVHSSNGAWIEVEADDGQYRVYHFAHFKQFGIPKRSKMAPATFKAQYQHDPYELQEVNEEDTATARPRVTSVGTFEKGDKVVYKDGTPIPMEYGYFRVVRCTATAVWFEHCYTMPFNPTEFKRA